MAQADGFKHRTRINASAAGPGSIGRLFHTEVPAHEIAVAL